MGTAIDAAGLVPRSGNEHGEGTGVLSITGTLRHLMIDDQDAFLVCWLDFRSTFRRKITNLCSTGNEQDYGLGRNEEFQDTRSDDGAGVLNLLAIWNQKMLHDRMACSCYDGWLCDLASLIWNLYLLYGSDMRWVLSGSMSRMYT